MSNSTFFSQIIGTLWMRIPEAIKNTQCVQYMMGKAIITI